MKQFRETTNGIEIFSALTGKVIASSEIGEDVVTNRQFRDFQYADQLGCMHAGELHVGFYLPGSETFQFETIDEANAMLKNEAIQQGLSEADFIACCENIDAKKAADELEFTDGDVDMEHTADVDEEAEYNREMMFEHISAKAKKISDDSFASTDLDDPDLGLKLKISHLAELIQELTALVAAKA